jgi:hypothetical protein
MGQYVAVPSGASEDYVSEDCNLIVETAGVFQLYQGGCTEGI